MWANRSSSEVCPSRSARGTWEKITASSSLSKSVGRDDCRISAHTFSRWCWGMCRTRSGAVSSGGSLSFRSLVSPERQCSVAPKKRPRFSLGFKNRSVFRNENSPPVRASPSSPRTSASALLPLPFFPITATRPAFRGTDPENHLASAPARVSRLKAISWIDLVADSLTRCRAGGSAPMNTRPSGSWQSCTSPSKVGSARTHSCRSSANTKRSCGRCASEPWMHALRLPNSSSKAATDSERCPRPKARVPAFEENSM